ncbi:MAG TPA: hypothetical protein VIK18_03730 [Pirellulales bacterium]
MTFPETVMRLIADGVERYRADLVRLEKTYYAPDGQTHIERMPLADGPTIAEHFSMSGVKDALMAIQTRNIDYPEFLRQIMAAGTTSYSVFLLGKKAIYTGRQGDFHVEHFPGSKPPATAAAATQ